MAAPPAAGAARPRFSFGGGGNKCATCAKTVYANEQVLYDSKYYHTECFKCSKCKTRLALVNVAVISGDLYCKPCFKKVFAEKGSYNSFGDKVVSNWTKEHRKSSVDGGNAPAGAPAHVEVGGKLEPVPEGRDRAGGDGKVHADKHAEHHDKHHEKPAEKPAEAHKPAPTPAPAAEAEKPVEAEKPARTPAADEKVPAEEPPKEAEAPKEKEAEPAADKPAEPEPENKPAESAEPENKPAEPEAAAEKPAEEAPAVAAEAS